MSNKNAEENLLKTWGETQQKLLTDWLDTLRRFGGTPTLELWRKTVDTWQTSVKETLDAQAAWAQQWTEALAYAKGTPRSSVNWRGKGASSYSTGLKPSVSCGRAGSTLYGRSISGQNLEPERKREGTWYNSGKTPRTR